MQYFSASDTANSPNVAAFYEPTTGSWQYIAWDPETKDAMIIDPVLDFDPAAGATWTYSADELLHYVREERLNVQWVIDTHPHADHFSSAQYIKEQLGSVPKQAIGKKILQVQEIWADLYADDALKNRPDHWDHLFEDGERFKVGNCEVRVMLTTGHTLASVSFVMGDAVFANDTFMAPDSGSGRADFPGGSSAELWDSLQSILALPDDTRVFVGHDYCKDGREPICMATVAQQKSSSIHVKTGTSREEFIATRDARDATLPMPNRMLVALLVNIRGGRLPDTDEKGRAVLRLPVNRFASKLAKSFAV